MKSEFLFYIWPPALLPQRQPLLQVACIMGLKYSQHFKKKKSVLACISTFINKKIAPFTIIVELSVLIFKTTQPLESKSRNT